MKPTGTRLLAAACFLAFLLGGCPPPPDDGPSPTTSIDWAWPAAATNKAWLIVDAGYAIGVSSTYFEDTFKLANANDASGARITRVVFDLTTAVTRDLVFDPLGEAGDTAGKVLTIDSQTGGDGDVGVASTDTAVVFSSPHSTGPGAPPDVTNGYDLMTVDFGDFEGGERLGFSVDVDPNSIKGGSPEGPHGPVSGADLHGATVTITFSDGSERTNTLSLIQECQTGSAASFAVGLPAAPTVRVNGSAADQDVSGTSHTVEVTGTAGAEVRVVVLKGSPVTAGDFDPDPYEFDDSLQWEEFFATLDGAGQASVAITLTNGAVGDYYNVSAEQLITSSTGGAHGPLSNDITLQIAG